ncbi:MAG: NAD(P)H-dependent oxidoreductase subunit E [Actinobacteria bacterium]|nr:NAD(P)H-dependent oxidoreductase subunit E [Actinomycetota bacterium]
MAVFEGATLAEARAIVARYPAGRERSSVMPLLYLGQSIEGRVTREALREVAELLGLTTAEIESVASFYTMIRLRPTGTHVVTVCTNLACALRGAKDVYEAAHRASDIPHGAELSEDGVISLHEEECMGACERAPVVAIDFAYHDEISPARVTELIQALRRGEVPAPSRGTAPRDFRHASRVLAGLEGDPA